MLLLFFSYTNSAKLRAESSELSFFREEIMNAKKHEK